MTTPVVLALPPAVAIAPTGAQGPRGNATLTGTGAPAASTGIDGDYYFDTANYPASMVLYGPKTDGAWPDSGVTLSNTAGTLLAANNLSDVADTAATRDNLGLGTAATLNVGTSAGTVAAGDDSRLSDARTPLPHAVTHGSGGSDAVTVAQSQVTGLPAALAALLPLAGGTVTGGLTVEGYTTLAGGQVNNPWPVVGAVSALAPDFSTVHELDPATGTAFLGKKNGADNISLCGRLTTTGTPTTGTDLSKIKANAAWGIYVFHNLVTGTPASTTEIAVSDFDAIIDAIAAQGIPVVPIGDALKYYG